LKPAVRRRRAAALRLPGLLVTCEHASNRVPPALRALFSGQRALLASHRGFDAGARAVARSFARRFDATLLEGAVSRLVIDLNRSAQHPHLLGPTLRALPLAARRARRAELLATLWEPYRATAEVEVAALLESHSCVLHLCVHSMTPTLGAVRRDMDVALLFDPERRLERELARAWRAELEAATGLRVAFNRPYRGTSDGHTTALRRVFAADAYAGVELELNQALLRNRAFSARLVRDLQGTLALALPVLGT